MKKRGRPRKHLPTEDEQLLCINSSYNRNIYKTVDNESKFFNLVYQRKKDYKEDSKSKDNEISSNLFLGKDIDSFTQENIENITKEYNASKKIKNTTDYLDTDTTITFVENTDNKEMEEYQNNIFKFSSNGEQNVDKVIDSLTLGKDELRGGKEHFDRRPISSFPVLTNQIFSKASIETYRQILNDSELDSKKAFKSFTDSKEQQQQQTTALVKSSPLIQTNENTITTSSSSLSSFTEGNILVGKTKDWYNVPKNNTTRTLEASRFHQRTKQAFTKLLNNIQTPQEKSEPFGIPINNSIIYRLLSSAYRQDYLNKEIKLMDMPKDIFEIDECDMEYLKDFFNEEDGSENENRNSIYKLCDKGKKCSAYLNSKSCIEELWNQNGKEEGYGFIGKAFYTPTVYANIVQSRYENYPSGPAFCFFCYIDYVNVVFYDRLFKKKNNTLNKNDNLKPINMFQVKIGEGQFSLYQCLETEIDGESTGIIGCFPKKVAVEMTYKNRGKAKNPKLHKKTNKRLQKIILSGINFCQALVTY